jgi:hypothetical protein
MVSSQSWQNPICLHSFTHSFFSHTFLPFPFHCPLPRALRVPNMWQVSRCSWRIRSPMNKGSEPSMSQVLWAPRFPSHTLRVQTVTDSSYIGAIIYGLNECLMVRVKQGQTDEQMCVSVQPSHAGGRWSRSGYARRGTGGSGLTDDFRALSFEVPASLLPDW